MSRLISRDPYARTELYRFTDGPYFNRAAASCYYCGCCTKTTKQGEDRYWNYKYYYVNDSGKESHIRGVFCSVSCMYAYHKP